MGVARRAFCNEVGGILVIALADNFNDQNPNSTNNLWIDSNYDVYFTNPRYRNNIL